MRTRFFSLRFVLNLLAGGLLLGGAASASQAQTVIDHLPYTITNSGTYVLNSNLNVSQLVNYLIQVNASNVTIDFQGHYIAGVVGDTTQSTYGINAVEQSNLTVKNGTIAYCSIGIFIGGNGTATTNSVGHRIDNMRLTYCYFTGVYLVNGPATSITNCQVSQTGSSGKTEAFGIYISGVGMTVSNNVVSTVTATTSYGITADAGNFIRRNTISNAKLGIYGGKYQDNLTSNCTTPYSNGNDAGGNN